MANPCICVFAGDCDGLGVLYARNGDSFFCVCGNDGEIECPGCKNCMQDEEEWPE